MTVSLLGVIGWNRGSVTRVVRTWPGVVEVEIEPDPVGEVATTTSSTVDARPVRAIAYTELTGAPEPGDLAVYNDNADRAGLGTGGGAIVVALPDRLPVSDDPPGHLVKARYTPLQSMVLGVDAQESPHHHLLENADSIDGLPVVVADLHSSLPAVIAGIRAERPTARVVYVMTDGGALPAAFSRSLAALTDAGWLIGTITTGQTYGGDWEAVSVYTGLLAARLICEADVAVVTQGPGNLGTGTRWGFSGVSAGEAMNAAAILGGAPIAALRVSQADPRPRHRGISHHSLTAYGRVLNRQAEVPVPAFTDSDGVPDSVRRQVVEQAAALEAGSPHLSMRTVATTGLREALATSPVTLSTMGRGMGDDPAAFISAAVAGRWAAGRSD